MEALWACVLAGLVDTIGSDHSPCTVKAKEIGYTDIWRAWSGISGIQTMLPGLLTEGVHKRGLAPPLLTRMISANPACAFGLYPRKGTIQPGSDADPVIVDPYRCWTLAAEDLYCRNRHSTFTGYSFRGCVERGRLHLWLEEREHVLESGGFAYVPADIPHAMTAESACRLTVFEERYQAAGSEVPGSVTGCEQNMVAEPFMGDPDAMLKTLLPTARNLIWR